MHVDAVRSRRSARSRIPIAVCAAATVLPALAMAQESAAPGPKECLRAVRIQGAVPGTCGELAWTQDGEERDELVQIDADGVGWYRDLLGNPIPEEARFRSRPRASEDLAGANGVTFHSSEDRVEIRVHGEEFTSYWLHDGARPYFFPVRAADGTELTRAYPRERREGEADDHPHHRSLWFAFGKVNGHDLWAENGPHGRIEHVSVDGAESGPVFGTLRTTARWLDPAGTPLLLEHKSVKVHGLETLRVLDLEISLEALAEAVTFGDTKEGMMALRLAPWLRVDRGAHLLDARGHTDGEVWGKAAEWADDFGANGDGTTYGVALLDHPSNHGHPTHWHARTYGLFAANPFGLHDFEKLPDHTGDLTLEAGTKLVFRYRLVFHPGDPASAAIAERYENWAAEPRTVAVGEH